MHPDNVGKQFEHLFHGTTHPFEVGDIVQPKMTSTGRKEAFAGTDADLAHEYARYKSETGEMGIGKKIPGAKGAEPRVYRVEPIDSTEDLAKHGYGEGIARSMRGFRIVERVR